LSGTGDEVATIVVETVSVIVTVLVALPHGQRLDVEELVVKVPFRDERALELMRLEVLLDDGTGQPVEGPVPVNEVVEFGYKVGKPVDGRVVVRVLLRTSSELVKV